MTIQELINSKVYKRSWYIVKSYGEDRYVIQHKLWRWLYKDIITMGYWWTTNGSYFNDCNGSEQAICAFFERKFKESSIKPIKIHKLNLKGVDTHKEQLLKL